MGCERDVPESHTTPLVLAPDRAGCIAWHIFTIAPVVATNSENETIGLSQRGAPGGFSDSDWRTARRHGPPVLPWLTTTSVCLPGPSDETHFPFRLVLDSIEKAVQRPCWGSTRRISLATYKCYRCTTEFGGHCQGMPGGACSLRVHVWARPRCNHTDQLARFESSGSSDIRGVCHIALRDELWCFEGAGIARSGVGVRLVRKHSAVAGHRTLLHVPPT